MHRLIFGCGYLGKRVGMLWSERGDRITVITRQPQRCPEFSDLGWAARVADVTDPASLRGLPTADSVLFAVGYDRRSGMDIRYVYENGLRNVLNALAEPPASFFYISSTGVYGQQQGEWVDETADCAPVTPGGTACWACEALLREGVWRDRSVVLRLAGIYGPGRVPHQQDLAQGNPLSVAAEGFLNLIHVDDAARVAVAVEETVGRSHTPVGHRVYNVSDGVPVRRGDFYRFAAELRGWPSPTFVPVDPASSAGQRARSDKRIDSTRLRRDISIDWLYPTYREGLAASIV